MGKIDSIIKSVIGTRANGFSLPWSRAGTWNKREQLLQYTRYVHTVVSAIAEDFAKIDVVVERKIGKEWQAIDNHPLYELLRSPNPDSSQFQFLEMHQTFMELVGESFWWVVKGQRSKSPKQLYLLRPDLVSVVIDENSPYGLVKGYVLKKPDGAEIPFERDEIIHFKLPNPKDPYRGMGVVEAAMMYLQTEEFASDFTRHSILNSGRPSGILNFKGRIKESEFEQIKRRFKKEYLGTKNTGKTMFINGAEALDYQKLGMEIGEVALQELRDMGLDNVMVMWRVSKTMLGISDDVNLNNAREARAVWLENTIRNKNDRFVDQLTSTLLPMFGKSNQVQRIGYADLTSERIEEQKDEWSVGWGKWLTTNDIRAERGLDPVEGGDSFYGSAAIIPLFGKLPEKEHEEEEKETEEAPAVPEEEQEDEKPEQKSVDTAEAKEAFRKTLFINQERWVDRYKDGVAKVFKEQEVEILERTSQKALEEWKFDAKKYTIRFLEELSPLTFSLMEEQAKLALGLAGDDETVFEITPEVRNYVRERITQFADSTQLLLIDEITESITEGISAGENLTKLRKRIQEIYSNATKSQAERIARTETISASNEAALSAYRQSPYVFGQEWLTEPGACEFCHKLNGKVIGVNEIFFANGESLTGVDGGTMHFDYSDIDHPPLHPNCQCSIAPVASYKFRQIQIEEKKKELESLDGRTKRAKELLKEIEEVEI